MSEKFLENVNKFGYAATPRIIGEKQIGKFKDCLSEIKVANSADRKKILLYGVRNLLNLSPEIKEFSESREIRDIVEDILGKDAKPVRAIFFDKTPEANWKVPWHQDLTIAVKEKRETEGFTVWTRKAGIQHVQPPVSLLEKMLAVRIHLDDNDETNGVLKVIPGSHKNGRLGAETIQNLRKTSDAKICAVKRGEGFLMRPLIVHSSSAGTNPKHRRVIHIEFAAENLPNNLEWYGS